MRWGDGTRWNSGARWPGKAPQERNKHMSIATTNTRALSPSQKVERGVTILAKGTANPLVPGNGPCLAAFSTSQTALASAVQAVASLRESLGQALTVRDIAELDWDNKVACLCAFTEAATSGGAVAIESAGFGVRAGRTPPQSLEAPINLMVQTNGAPGVSKLSWQLSDADTFLVERSPEPVTADSWEQVFATTKSSCEVPGALPGQKCWFRVAGVNAAGQGPWSAVAPRPVM